MMVAVVVLLLMMMVMIIELLVIMRCMWLRRVSQCFKMQCMWLRRVSKFNCYAAWGEGSSMVADLIAPFCFTNAGSPGLVFRMQNAMCCG